MQFYPGIKATTERLATVSFKANAGWRSRAPRLRASRLITKPTPKTPPYGPKCRLRLIPSTVQGRLTFRCEACGSGRASGDQRLRGQCSAGEAAASLRCAWSHSPRASCGCQPPSGLETALVTVHDHPHHQSIDPRLANILVSVLCVPRQSVFTPTMHRGAPTVLAGGNRKCNIWQLSQLTWKQLLAYFICLHI